MRLYRVSAKDNPTKWFGTQSECASERKALNSKGVPRAEIVTEEVEVPTNKKELLEWLNNNVRG